VSTTITYGGKVRRLGDEWQSHGVNGHLFDRWVTETSRGGLRVESDHSGKCGCVREPWEYDPLDAY
jgi:hypothetical protein